MGLEKLFQDRTGSVYSGMVHRFRERRNKNNKIIRQKREIPFNLPQFREWALAQFKGNVDAPIPCHYCKTWIDVGSFATDHDVPTSRGGTLGLDNLKACCDECNLAKGKLTGDEWLRFIEKMSDFEPEARTDIFSRLRMGAGYVRLAFQKKKEKERDEKRPPIAAEPEKW